MKPPILRRFLAEDYQDAPSWFGRFISVLNSFMEQTVALLDKNVSIGDNIHARKFNTSFTTSASYSTGNFDQISFTWTSRELPQVVLIAGIRQDIGQFLGSVGTPQWTYVNGSIVVTYIPGLAPSTKYSISFIVL